MGFLSPWFLGGLLAASLPIYVHLLRQHKTDPIRFSSVMFLERRTQSSVKHRRLKYLALFAMRLAIVLLLALMFANPFIRRSAGAGEGGRRHLVIAVDNSFSMRAGDRLAQAKQEAMNVVGSMGAADRGQVVSFASSVSLLTQPTTDKAELQRAIAAIQPGDGRSAYGEVSRTLRTMGSSSNGLPVEAHVITDMQRSSMPTPFAELAVPPSTRLVLHEVAQKTEPNWYVESVNAPRNIFEAKQVRVQTTVAGSATEAADGSVELVLNGKTVETRKVSIPASGRTTVEFFLSDPPYGLNRGEVRLTTTDILPQDNRFLFSLERREGSRVLFVHDARNARAATYYRSALESVPDAGYTVEAVPSEQAGNVSPNNYAAVVLSDAGAIPASLENALKEYVRQGGGVLIALGPSASARNRIPVTGEALDRSRYASREGERFFASGEVDASHPAVGRTGGFENVKFYQTVALKPGQGRVLAKLSDGSPLLVEHRLGEGRVLVFASTFDNIANDLPLHASFVPFIEQSARYLSGTESAPALYVVDSFVELRAARDSGTAVDVLDPDGKRALSLKEAADTQAFRLPREGFFELRRANGRNELIAAHADRRESSLEVVPKETLALWQGTGNTETTAAGPADQNSRLYSLWWYFALALLVVSLVESFFATRYLTAEQQPAMPVRKQAA